MRYLILFFVVFTFNFGCLCQYTISSSYISIIKYTIKISYSSKGYVHAKPQGNFYQNVQSTLQARYDYNHQWCSNEYWRVKDLNLINSNNISTLNNYKNERLTWVYNAIKTWNLGVDQNAYTIINYCSEIFTYSNIKAEIKLLKAINMEINYLKRTYPSQYHLTKRYNELGLVLEQLKSCEPSEISSLAWNYGLN
jgi:hypothetical protein